MPSVDSERQPSALARLGVTLTICVLIAQALAIVDIIQDLPLSHDSWKWSESSPVRLPLIFLPAYILIYYLINGGLADSDRKVASWLYKAWAISILGGGLFCYFRN